jgi:tetraacyldisaccharide 4'-kinase
MLSPTQFRDLVSGRQRGVAPSLTRSLLRAAEVPYTIAVDRRNRRFDRGHSQVHRANIPLISVGNITLGGTGKTPMVKWFAQKLQAAGARVALVSRGYGATNGKLNDEALELAEALPGVPHVQNRDRVAAANDVIREHNPQVIILDDGFQHRRLARDLDIVLLDALEPFGFNHVFPRGTLREPLAGLARAHAVCLSRADAVTPAERDAIRQRVAELAPQTVWCELAHAPTKLTNSLGESAPFETLVDKRIAAFCGIGNPAGFRHTLSAVNIKPVAWREFADHHSYTPADEAEIISIVQDSQSDAILCTHKDLVKLPSHELGRIPLWAVAIEMKFLAGQSKLESLIDALVSLRLRRG